MKNIFKPVNTDIGILILRLVTAGLMLFHGIHKFFHAEGAIKGHAHILQGLSDKGLPSFLWIGVPIAEIIVPILFILGVFTRISGVLTVILMTFTLWFWGAEAFTLTSWGSVNSEVNLYFLFSGAVLFFTGGGKYALYKPANDWLK